MQDPKLIKQTYIAKFPVDYPKQEINIVNCFLELKRTYQVKFDPEANQNCLFITEKEMTLSINKSGHTMIWTNGHDTEIKQVLLKLWKKCLKKNLLSQT